MTSLSIVEYFGKNGKGSCGYCKGKKTSFSHGMWGHVLTPQDYQDLIDRGWRRSGKYVYKPVMHETCCPQYTIRCSAPDFRPTKSHKKTLKKFRNFVLNDAGSGRKLSHKIAQLPPHKRDPLYSSDDDDTTTEDDSVDDDDAAADDFEAENADQAEKKIKFDTSKAENQPPTASSVVAPIPQDHGATSRAASSMPPPPPADQTPPREKRPPKPGLGPDPTKPKPRKAKDIRKERALMKAAGGGADKAEKPNRKAAAAPPLEQLTEFFLRGDQGKHKFEVRMVRATQEDPEFRKTVDESFEVYRKYQVMIHKDKPNECSMSQFQRFLCSSPILEGEPIVANAAAANFPAGFFPTGYGGYHQQYVLDGKIICVGVLDILPRCVSSVYLYYDPDYSFLSLGTVSALMEITYVRSLQSHWSDKLTQYYMGFYIHSCPKMRYKAQYSPSQLLCPQTFAWIDVKDCISLLDKTKYARLNRTDSSPDQLSATPSKERLGRVSVLYRHRPTRYAAYNRAFAAAAVLTDEDREIAEYYNLVGDKVSQCMLLYRASD